MTTATEKKNLLDRDPLWLRLKELLKHPEGIPFWNGRGTTPVLIYNKKGIRLYQNQNTREIFRMKD